MQVQREFFFIYIVAVFLISHVSVYQMNILSSLLLDIDPMFVLDTEVLQIYNVGAMSNFDAKTMLAETSMHLIFEKTAINQAAFKIDSALAVNTESALSVPHSWRYIRMLDQN